MRKRIFDCTSVCVEGGGGEDNWIGPCVLMFRCLLFWMSQGCCTAFIVISFLLATAWYTHHYITKIITKIALHNRTHYHMQHHQMFFPIGLKKTSNDSKREHA